MRPDSMSSMTKPSGVTSAAVRANVSEVDNEAGLGRRSSMRSGRPVFALLYALVWMCQILAFVCLDVLTLPDTTSRSRYICIAVGC